MTIRFVGPGGSDGATGLTWALRKLTLNGVEDTPVAAGDTVYVGPGVYRELLTVDVDGTSGAGVITYIGDVTGENTDGIGGIVRITGSDDDLSATRSNCVFIQTDDYRTFRGFQFDMATSSAGVRIEDSTNIIIEDCVFGPFGGAGSALPSLRIDGTLQANVTIRRCIFHSMDQQAILINEGTKVDNVTHLIENCLFLGGQKRPNDIIGISRVGGIIIKNCTFTGGEGAAVDVDQELTVGQTVTINNCQVVYMQRGFRATITGEIIENYNNIYGVLTARNNVATGANSTSVAFIPYFPPMLDGFQIWKGNPFFPMMPSEWDTSILAGTGEAADDLFGLTRPTTSAKKSWGAIQAVDEDPNETGTVNGGTYSHKLGDAGRIQIIVPVTNESTTFTVQVNREADYTGTAPQMIIKQPGIADDITVDAGAAGAWNELTTTLTPDAGTDFVVVELVSNNTAAATNFATYFDDLVIS